MTTDTAHASPPRTEARSIDRVLVPIAAPSEAPALSAAVERVGARSVHALYVVDTRSELGHLDPVVERAEDRGEAAVDELADRIDAAREVVRHFRYGVPHEEILDYAADHGVDVVVMGNYARSGLARLRNPGSVGRKVQRRADRPVLTVPVEG